MLLPLAAYAVVVAVVVADGLAQTATDGQSRTTLVRPPHGRNREAKGVAFDHVHQVNSFGVARPSGIQKPWHALPPKDTTHARATANIEHARGICEADPPQPRRRHSACGTPRHRALGPQENVRQRRRRGGRASSTALLHRRSTCGEPNAGYEGPRSPPVPCHDLAAAPAAIAPAEEGLREGGEVRGGCCSSTGMVGTWRLADRARGVRVGLAVQGNVVGV
mmetsp:Transcript_46385/g.120415  ORF Transcript_46385/g.120415 Transcript_46385/m.120415 type:complete len:221 (-) Transcript_46385:907-1569(-)